MARVSPDALEAVVRDLLRAGGVDHHEAEIVAETLTWADARQRYPQGCVWIDALLSRLAVGGLTSPSRRRVTDVSPASAVIDAGGGFGHVAMREAVDLATEKADAVGVGLVAVIESTHFGAAGHYAARLAERGYVGLAFTNALPKVAAHGGVTAVLGTNPLAFSAPVAGSTRLVGDLSTGALAGSRVREAIERGEPLEPGMALDAAGRPTTDPRALQDGGVMLPTAGAKGFALGLLVELVTSVLGGGAVGREVGSMFDAATPVRASHSVLAIRPFDAGFAARAAGLLAQVAQSDDAGEVRIPGDHRERAALSATATGIDLPADSRARLRQWSERLGYPLPSAFDSPPSGDELG